MLYLRNVVFLTGTLNNFMKTSESAFGENPPFSYIKPSSVWKAGLEYTEMEVIKIVVETLRKLPENFYES